MPQEREIKIKGKPAEVAEVTDVTIDGIPIEDIKKDEGQITVKVPPSVEVTWLVGVTTENGETVYEAEGKNEIKLHSRREDDVETIAHTIDEEARKIVKEIAEAVNNAGERISKAIEKKK